MPRGLLVALAVVVLLVIGHRPLLSALGRALIVDEPSAPADAILVLGGGGGSRHDKAIELYRSGLAPTIISSGDKVELPGFDKTYAEYGVDYMVVRGIPREVIQVQNGVTSTREEALAVLESSKQQGYRTLIVVTDNYHTGRARLTFRQVFHRTGIRLIFIAATPDWVDWKRWWMEERSLLAILQEYIKLIFYLFKGYLI